MFNDERSFNFVLAHEVQSQIALNDLQQLLGPGFIPDEAQRQNLIKATRDFAQQTPDAYPDGTELDDQFIGYEIGSNVHYLQFRSGRIVNFDPREYNHSFELKTTAR